MNIAIDIYDTITNTYETMVPMIALFYNKDLNKLLQNKPSYKEFYSLPNFSTFAMLHFLLLLVSHLLKMVLLIFCKS